MISRKDFMKQKAVDILTDRVESRMVTLGSIAPNITMKTFSGNNIKLYDLLQENHLVLSFMRGSW